MKWTCKGTVRGSCWIDHKSYEGAVKCCQRDSLSVMRGHGGNAYSDRFPVPVDDEARAQHKRLKSEE